MNTPSTQPTSIPPLLEMRSVTRTFPGVRALSEVSLKVWPGEVVALVGENGAGKSTLMKVLGGLYQPDQGAILVDGESVEIRSVADAQNLGIGFVHQELNVLDNIDIAGNIFLGREKFWGGPLHLLNRSAMRQSAKPALQQLGVDLDPSTPVGTLSLAQKQMVEIARALAQNVRLVIMDEPTSSLTHSETAQLMQVIRDLKRQGISVIYISHRLSEVSICADRVVGLRDGANAGELAKDEITHDRMVSLMVGRDWQSESKKQSVVGEPGLFKVSGLRTQHHPDQVIDFDLRFGEILCFAGLVGAGRSEMAQALFGISPPLAGDLFLHNQRVRIHSSQDAIQAGIYLIPEDRRLYGLITEMSLCENISLPSLKRYTNWMLVNRWREKQMAQKQVDDLRIKTPSISTPVINLSGGNQQKVTIGKWLAMNPRVLIFDEPTRGVDVRSKQEIYALMRGLACEGVGILMISSDLEEVLNVSDRIAVMHEGCLTGILDPPQFSEEAVIHLAVGRQRNHAVC